ncbi:hypothetical protein ATCC90586_006793 [Pythium insidiosum]|nr:hypothetical protein ATCC90586_006793 [Pythium insidiosum]
MALAMDTTTRLQRKLWEGHVPVVFSLHASDVTTLHAPRPFYAMVPRVSYLIAQTRAVLEYFRDAAPPIAGIPGNAVWFEADGRPLRWHLPFGLLFDLHHASTTRATSSDGAALPWKVVVHFSKFPADQLLPCENEKTMEMHFMHSLKQATFLRTGSTKLIMAMSEAQQTLIWTSLLQNDLPSYLQATQELQIASSETLKSTLRLVPLRLYVEDEPTLQLPVAPRDSDDKHKTLGDVLSTVLPDLFAGEPQRLVVTHGIVVPLHVPVLALYQSFAYPDGFLHVAIINKSTP